MPAPIATSLRAILPAIQAQLASVTGLTTNRVLLVQRETTPRFQGDQDVLVRAGPPQPEDGFELGSGRHAAIVTRLVQVTARTRWAVDESDRDDYALVDEDYGHLALEEAVVNALHIWVPTDRNGNWLSVEPMHWRPHEAPVHDEPLPASWLSTSLLFDVRYHLSLPSNGY
jgi:hypothetical protein